ADPARNRRRGGDHLRPPRAEPGGSGAARDPRIANRCGPSPRRRGGRPQAPGGATAPGRRVRGALGTAVHRDRRERVRAIIGNLVSNALKYTPAGGRVTLAAAVTENGPHGG